MVHWCKLGRCCWQKIHGMQTPKTSEKTKLRIFSLQPPIVPKVYYEGDSGNFDEYDEEELSEISEAGEAEVRLFDDW